MKTEHAQLWQALQQANCVDVDTPLPHQPLMPPWYLGILQGFAGWVAALFLLGFMGSFLALSLGEVLDEGILFIAAIFVVIGAVLDRKSLQQQVFVTQLALVFGLSGLLGVGWGLSEILGYRSEQAPKYVQLRVKQLINHNQYVQQSQYYNVRTYLHEFVVLC